jgi:hypothetical protein
MDDEDKKIQTGSGEITPRPMSSGGIGNGGGGGSITSDELKKILQAQPTVRYSRLPSQSVPVSRPVADTIEQEKKRIENEGLRQNINLKRKTLWILFWFLAAETALIFLLAFFQGFTAWHFHLEEWSFKLLVTATISQITVMLFVAVKHLFPSH